MTVSLADHFGVSEDLYDSTGAFDPILGVDSRLFIDPVLLRQVSTPELEGSHGRVVDYFMSVLRVVGAIDQPHDRMWRQADELLKFPEVASLSIGYSSSGTSGSGMGPALRARLLESIRQIVRAGVNDPAIFEIVGIFEVDVGPDRISDMIAKIIAPDLIRFTQRVCSDCGIPMSAHRLRQLGVEEDLPSHPETGQPLLLLPKEILKDLPVAASYSDVRWIAEQNAELREQLNHLVGSAWREVTVAEQKERLHRTFLERPDILREILRAYLDEAANPYNFDEDRSGEVIWYRTSKRLPEAAPLALELSEAPTLDEVELVVVAICNHFKHLVEHNQLARLLYDDRGQQKHESAAQLLFFGIASSYCSANDLDLAPESDAGRGPVDFKMSRGFAGKVLVEVKLTSNKQLAHGFERQLPIYQEAEHAQRGVYLVIDNGGASQGRLESFRARVRDAKAPAPRVIWVDGSWRQSASRADE